ARGHHRRRRRRDRLVDAGGDRRRPRTKACTGDRRDRRCAAGDDRASPGERRRGRVPALVGRLLRGRAVLPRLLGGHRRHGRRGAVRRRGACGEPAPGRDRLVSGDVRDDVVIDSARTMEGVSTASEERRRGELPSRRLRLREAVLRRPGLWLAVLVAAAAAVIGLLRARGPVVPVAVAVRTDLEQHLVASGRVRTVARVELLAQIAGRVASVHVEDGDRVAAGALLVRIDDAELRAEAAQARAAVAQAAGRLENLRNQTTTVAQQALKQSEAVLAFEEAELARLERLAAAGAVPPVDVDAARRRVAVARAERDAAAAKLEAAGPDGAERRVAESALRESRARLDAAEARLAHTRVTAPQAGTVLQRAVEPGDTVRIGDVLVVMAADGPTQLLIEPDERNLAWIRPGQRALVAADAHPEAVFE